MNESSLVLSERLAQGPLSSQEALRYAVALAESLRQLHDQGAVVGALEPSKITLSGAGVSLQSGGPVGEVTPYSAPEQLQGQAPDVRSDIFAFGAIVYEMFSGRKAFPGSSADELRTAILEREPAPLEGDIARVTSKCLAKAPIQRWQRMQRIQMELKLLTVFARRGEVEPVIKADRVQAMLRQEIAQLESRVAERFATHDAAAAELRARLQEQDGKLQAAVQTEQALRGEISSLEARLGARLDAGDIRVGDFQKQAADHEAKIASSGEAAAALLHRLEAGDIKAAEFQKHIAEHEAKIASSGEAAAILSRRLDAVDQTLKHHGSSLQSLESAITQTDDLVERVVEAFDSLEKSLGQDETKTAVNGHR
jgi:eukaryotic-like serine/threonine-protein kinase